MMRMVRGKMGAKMAVRGDDAVDDDDGDDDGEEGGDDSDDSDADDDDKCVDVNIHGLRPRSMVTA